MTRTEHYIAAEELLSRIDRVTNNGRTGMDFHDAASIISLAQVHATLATATDAEPYDPATHAADLRIRAAMRGDGR